MILFLSLKKVYHSALSALTRVFIEVNSTCIRVAYFKCCFSFSLLQLSTSLYEAPWSSRRYLVFHWTCTHWRNPTGVTNVFHQEKRQINRVTLGAVKSVR